MKRTQQQIKEDAMRHYLEHGEFPKGWKRDSQFLGRRKGATRVGESELIAYKADHTCDVCGEIVLWDMRHLRISCFYDLTEVSTKFQLDKENKEYTLAFCKPCRGHFMFAILAPWLESKGHKEHPNWNGESQVQYV